MHDNMRVKSIICHVVVKYSLGLRHAIYQKRFHMNTKFKLAFLSSIAITMLTIGPSVVYCQQTTAPNSKTVLLHVAVTTDGGGGFASGVSKDSFLVISDNVERPITLFQDGPVPSSICIVLDTTEKLSLFHSGKGNYIREALARGFSEFQNLSQDTQYSIVGFGEHPQLLLDWTKDLNAVEHTVGSVELKGRQSALYDACFTALEKLGQSANQKRVLLIISGSSDNKSRHKFSELRRAVRDKGYLVYTVGIMDILGPQAEIQNDRQWRSEMGELSTISGGLATSAGDADSVLFHFSNLSQELQRQYMIGFSATDDTQKEQYHKVQVKLRGTQPGLKGLRVRSREGYSTNEN